MLEHRTEGTTKQLRDMAERAIELALRSQWREAVAANREILQYFPDNVDAYNRLGKALTGLGHYQEAQWAYRRALEIEPSNPIARKNLERLAQLGDEGSVPAKGHEALGPKFFIEEMGKTAQVSLHNPAPSRVLARTPAGSQIYLRVRGKTLEVVNAQGEYLGQVESKLGFHLIKLIEGGNRYAAAIVSLVDETANIMIREIYQHPTLAGRISFPPRSGEAFRTYLKDSLLRYELEDEEEGAEGEEYEYEDSWEEEHEPRPHEKHPYAEEPLHEEDTDDIDEEE